MRNYWKLVFCLFLSACGSTEATHPNPIAYYTPPSHDEAGSSQTVIVGALENPGLLLSNRCFIVSEIDGRWIKDIDPLHGCITPVAITPGSHRVGVMFFLEDYPRGKTMLRLDAAAGHTYQVKFDMPTWSVPMEPKVWIDDAATGKVASQTTDMDVPIFSFGQISRLDEKMQQDAALCSGHGVKDKGEGLAACTRLIDAAPNGSLAPLALNTRASYYVDAARYDLAIADADRAIRVKSDFAPAYATRCFVRHLIQKSAGRIELSNALDDCKEALRLDPNNIAALNAIGIFYTDHDDDLALSYFTRAIEIAPDAAVSYLNRAVIQLRTKHYALAIEDSSQALRLVPGSSYTLEIRGLAYLGRKQYKAAVADFEAAQKGEKGDRSSLLYAKGIAELRIGKTAEGRADIARAKSGTPNMREDCVESGRCAPAQRLKREI